MKRWIALAVMFVLMTCGLFAQQARLEKMYTEPEEQAENQLVIVSCISLTDDDPRIGAAQAAFKSMHPEYALHFKRIEESRVNERVASGDPEADLYVLRNVEPEWKFADLSAYDRLAAVIDEHWIDVGAMRDKEGRMICLPDKLELRGLSTLIIARDMDAIREMGMELPGGGVSYDEFRTLAHQAKENGRLLLAMDSGAEHIFDAYCAMYPETGLDTPEFREMLVFWKEMRDGGYVVFADDVDSAGALLTCSCGSVMDGEHHSSDLHVMAVTNGMTMYFPSADERERAAILMWAWYMPQSGVQKRIAADFLTCLASVDAQEKLRQGGGGMMLKDLQAYKRSWLWTLPQVAGFEAYPGLNAEGYKNWVSLLENSVCTAKANDRRAVFGEVSHLYFEGGITADDLIALMQ